MLRKIKLYGHLREYTGLKEVEAVVSNVREAVSFLICNWPKLEAKIVQNNYHVLLDEDDVGEEELLHPIGHASISFIPVVEGSGKYGRILAGVALIGASFFFPGAGLFGTVGFGGAGFGAAAGTYTGLAVKGGILTTIGTGLSIVGASMVLGGVAELLAPPNPTPEAEQTPESSAFSSPLNVSMPGVAVPLVYGTAICGSIVINTSLEIGEVEA